MGVALRRLFTEDDCYSDDETPELAVAGPADAAWTAGVARLGLNVDAGNPAPAYP